MSVEVSTCTINNVNVVKLDIPNLEKVLINDEVGGISALKRLLFSGGHDGEKMSKEVQIQAGPEGSFMGPVGGDFARNRGSAKKEAFSVGKGGSWMATKAGVSRMADHKGLKLEQDDVSTSAGPSASQPAHPHRAHRLDLAKVRLLVPFHLAQVTAKIPYSLPESTRYGRTLFFDDMLDAGQSSFFTRAEACSRQHKPIWSVSAAVVQLGTITTSGLLHRPSSHDLNHLRFYHHNFGYN
ncbi:hypothetical protein OF83DRAFT_1295216 [Amylostereum chailletii]|nr:hypothetical protein OF83DRAFT_1295216 [Amylostereum chailletii]